MTHTDPTLSHAQLLLRREAALAERYARRHCLAVDDGDLDAARRFNRQYRLSAFRCRALGALLRTPATADLREHGAAFAPPPAAACTRAQR